jgi:hypothetical protein
VQKVVVNVAGEIMCWGSASPAGISGFTAAILGLGSTLVRLVGVLGLTETRFGQEIWTHRDPFGTPGRGNGQ